jgi:UDP-N-acetylglucosamine:LPS N-acetylglucosamine transferase
VKKILILTAGFGEGHNSAARNLRDGFLHVSEGRARVRVLDLFEEAYGQTNEFSRRAYLTAINKTPRLWSLFYLLLDKTPLVPATLWTLEKALRRLHTILEEEKPDLVCSTYPVYALLIDKLVRRHGPRPYRFATIVTDSISVNSLWHRAPSDVYIVPNRDTADVMTVAGVPSSHIRPLGFPVQLDFSLRRGEFPSPTASEKPRILYIINSGKANAPRIVRDLLDHPEWQLTLAVGRDETLREEITRITAPHADRVQVIGWTQEMPALLMQHHVVISKAGGATVQESLAARTPMIINQIVPGQEEGNYELIRRYECGVLAERPGEVALRLREVFDQGAALWSRWKANLEKLSHPDSSIRAAQELLRDV